MKLHLTDAFNASMTVEITSSVPGVVFLAPGHSQINPERLHEVLIEVLPETIEVSVPGLPYKVERCLTAWDAADQAVEFLSDLLLCPVACLDGVSDAIRAQLAGDVDQCQAGFPISDPESTPALHAA